MSVLVSDYSAYDLADYIADVSEQVAGVRVWDMDAVDLALLAHFIYPDGAVGLLAELMN